MGARSNLFRSAAREGVVIRGREFHEFDYANPAFNEIIKCIGTNFGKKKLRWKFLHFRKRTIIGTDNCRPPRTEESLQQPFAADEIVLPLICIIQCARERWIGFYRAWNRACSRKGWWERVELRSTEEFMDRRKKRGSKCKCTRFAVKFHFFFFFSFSYFPSFLSLGFFLQSRRNFEGGKVDCKTELSLV